MAPYGKELVIDLVNCRCDGRFTRQRIEDYLAELCDAMDVVREELHWWDYQDEPEEYDKAPEHMKGVSVVQFISKSTVVIHTLDIPRSVMVNIFSCGDFDTELAEKITLAHFGGEMIARREFARGVKC